MCLGKHIYILGGKMDAIVFTDHRIFDDLIVRTSILRIPEVSQRLTQAQEILESMDYNRWDLVNFVNSDNSIFLRETALRNLASAVMQIALFDRYRRFQPHPQVMVGCYNGDSALKVCTGQTSFEKLVKESQAAQALGPLQVVEINSEDPVLSGARLAEYEAFRTELTGGKIQHESLGVRDMDFQRVVKHLIDEVGVQKLIAVGMGGSELEQIFRNEEVSVDVQILNSVDLDPMLSWFWSQVRHVANA